MVDDARGGIQILLDYANEILALRQSALENNWEIPELPEEQPQLDYSIHYEKQNIVREDNALNLDEIRFEMQREIQSYLRGREKKKPLLICVPAGVGKTHTGITVAQEAAHNDLRVAWFAQRKSTFDEDIAGFPHFERALWYFWVAVNGTQNDLPVCDYSEAQMRWTSAGYISKDLCNMLCKANGHYYECPFIKQRYRPEPVVFARHNHLTVGMPMKDKFDVAIIDELPLSAFLKEREIDIRKLDIKDAATSLKDMIDQIQIMSLKHPKRKISGKELFTPIDGNLRDIFARLEMNENYVYPKPPIIHDAVETRELQPFWIHDFMKIAAVEHSDFINGKTEWAERVWLSDSKLHMLFRNKTWDDLPRKKIILDATGDPAMYEKLFGEEPIVYKPTVKRAGKIYQIAYRNNGKQSLNNDSSKAEVLEIIDGLISKYQYKNVGVICHKENENYFGEHYIRTRHFGALRGTNELEDCDVLFVIGNQAANLDSIIKTALALDNERRVPFFVRYSQIRDNYSLSLSGMKMLKREHDATSAWRLTGRYADNTLETVARQARQTELEQAIHRSRVNKNKDTTVWILSALPMGEPVDWLMEQPPFGPVDIGWKLWKRLDNWLNEQYKLGIAVDYGKVCAAMKISEGWARSNMLLEKIITYYPQRWSRPDFIVPVGATKIILPT